MVKVLSVAVTLQLTDLWYKRRSELVDNQIESRGFEQGLVAPHRHFRFGLACASFGQNNIHSRRFEDEEDLFVRDIDTFDDLEAREPSKFGSAVSVFFYIDNKTQLNADLWSYSEAFKFIKKIGGSKRTRRVAKGVNRAANAYGAGQQISNTFQSRGLEDDEYLYGLFCSRFS